VLVVAVKTAVMGSSPAAWGARAASASHSVLSMSRAEDRVSLPAGDFRLERQYLASHIFALGGDIPDPDNVVDEEAWRDLVDLPTDVLLRTTSYVGGVVDHLRDLVSCWHEDGFSQVASPDLLPMAFLDVQEELNAGIFNSIHGYYRTGISCLRVAAEDMVAAAAGLHSESEPLGSKWGTNLKVARDKGLSADLTRGERIKLLGGARGSWAFDLHETLSRHTHGAGGATNGELWKSNGPVLSRETLQLFVSLFEETLMLLYVLRSMFFPGASVSDYVVETLDAIEQDGHAAIELARKVIGA